MNVDMNTASQQPITSYAVSTATGTSVQKWCDQWNKKATKAGVAKTKMFAKLVERPNVRGTYSLSLLQIGKAPLTHSFRALKLDEITEDILRTATAGLMNAAKIVTVFDY